MARHSEHGYFFSIQPFWTPLENGSLVTSSDGNTSASAFHWEQDRLFCVPGNGQVGIMLQGPENFSGYCYGVLDSLDSIPLHGMEEGCLIRFSPGSFSKICSVPANLIDPCGMPLEELFSQDQLAKMKDAMAAPVPTLALLQLFSGWAEQGDASPPREQELARQVTRLIWTNHGNIRIRDLEKETAYSGRYLQEVTGRKIGLSPKQMCRQIRFQSALRLLQSAEDVNLSLAAQMLGYSDQAHFSKEFKAFSGLSPSQYQKEYFAKKGPGDREEAPSEQGFGPEKAK